MSGGGTVRGGTVNSQGYMSYSDEANQQQLIVGMSVAMSGHHLRRRREGGGREGGREGGRATEGKEHSIQMYMLTISLETRQPMITTCTCKICTFTVYIVVYQSHTLSFSPSLLTPHPSPSSPWG